MSHRPQSFEHHAKLVTGYHKVGFLLLVVPFIWTIVSMVQDFSVASLMAFIALLGVMFVQFYARVFPLGVQDRLIRLEEQLRMERVLPDDLKARMMEITTNQLVGLRFAPDDELPDLVRQVLDGSLTTRKDIKAAVKNWKADHERI